MDVHVHKQITNGLRSRGTDVLTAQEDNAAEIEDDLLLDRAMTLRRALFAQDEDFLVEAAARQRMGRSFAGLIYGHQMNVTIGGCIDDLELIAKVYEPDEIANLVLFLPLG